VYVAHSKTCRVKQRLLAEGLPESDIDDAININTWQLGSGAKLTDSGKVLAWPQSVSSILILT